LSPCETHRFLASLAVRRIHTAIRDIACAAAMKSRRSSINCDRPVGSCRDLRSHDGFREEFNPSCELFTWCAATAAAHAVVVGSTAIEINRPVGLGAAGLRGLPIAARFAAIDSLPRIGLRCEQKTCGHEGHCTVWHCFLLGRKRGRYRLRFHGSIMRCNWPTQIRLGVETGQ
jgi:hypothetical protein